MGREALGTCGCCGAEPRGASPAQPPCSRLPLGFPQWRPPWGPAVSPLAWGGLCAVLSITAVAGPGCLGARPVGVGVTGSPERAGRTLGQALLSQVPS